MCEYLNFGPNRLNIRYYSGDNEKIYALTGYLTLKYGDNTVIKVLLLKVYMKMFTNKIQCPGFPLQ